MDPIDKAYQTQIENIQKKTGKNLDELFTIIKNSGFEKHAQIRDMIKTKLNLGFGDANTLVHAYKNSLQASSPTSDSLDNILTQIYSGSREELLPLHNKVMDAIHKLGEFEIAPKKNYLSLRRKKQFAMVGPGTKNRLEIGLNMKGVSSTERLQEQPAGGMCQYKVWLTEKNEVDDELIKWIKTAYEFAG